MALILAISAGDLRIDLELARRQMARGPSAERAASFCFEAEMPAQRSASAQNTECPNHFDLLPAWASEPFRVPRMNAQGASPKLFEAGAQPRFGRKRRRQHHRRSAEPSELRAKFGVILALGRI